VLDSILDRFRDEFEAHLLGGAPPAEPVVIAELLDIADGVAILDGHHLDKQLDWSYGDTGSGSTPVELRARWYRTRPRRSRSL
jgi:hypothetical protein